MSSELERFNVEVQDIAPGYYLRCTGRRSLGWELIGADGKVHYRRDSLEEIRQLVYGKLLLSKLRSESEK